MTRVQQGRGLDSQISSWQGCPWQSRGLSKTRPSNTGASGLIPGQRTKIPCAVWQKKKKKKKNHGKDREQTCGQGRGMDWEFGVG